MGAGASANIKNVVTELVEGKPEDASDIKASKYNLIYLDFGSYYQITDYRIRPPCFQRDEHFIINSCVFECCVGLDNGEK